MTTENKLLIRCRAVIIHDGKLLVVKHKPENKIYALPGGHFEWGEDIKTCLEREIIEELGIKPQIGRLLYINNFVKEGVQSIEFIFEITNGNEFVNLTAERSHAHEIAEIKWMEKGNAELLKPSIIATDFKNGTILSGAVRFIKKYTIGN